MYSTTARASEHHLLVVDDDPAQVRLFQVSLQLLGLNHVCDAVASGPEALKFLYRRPPYENAMRPSLIVVDLNMPGMDGCEVVCAIKADPELRSIPVIVLSNSKLTDDVQNCYNAQANAYIQKPANLAGNLETVEGLDRFWFGTVTLPR